MEDKLCKACGTRKAQGRCIINGVRQNLVNTCRHCFMQNPEEIDNHKKKFNPNYHRYHEENR